MNNNENGCIPKSCENDAEESVAEVLDSTKNLLDQAMDVVSKIMDLLCEKPEEAPHQIVENLVCAARTNREVTRTLVQLMDRIAELLGC